MKRLIALIEKFRVMFARLSTRERVLVGATLGGALIFIVVLISVVVNLSLGGARDRLNTKRENYERIISLKERYKEAEAELTHTKDKIKNNRNTLMEDIGNMAQRNGIAINQITQSNGQVDKKAGVREESVKVELRKVELSPCLKFLADLENASPLSFLRGLQIRRSFTDPKQLDVTFSISTLVPIGNEN